MNKEYSQQEINQIILSKRMDEFYVATLLNTLGELSEEDMHDLESKFYVKGKKSLLEKIVLKSPRGTNMLSKFIHVREAVILTIIDGQIYDVQNRRFIEKNTKKIIHYDNLTNYYNENNSRFKIVSPNEYPKLKEESAMFDVDDEYLYISDEYDKLHVISKKYETTDLTMQFLEETKQKTYHIRSIK